VRQYEIWWASLPLPVGRRPVLLLSRNPAYAYLNKVLVAEVTTMIRGIPQEVTVGRPEGLPSASVVNLDNLHTVARRRLTKRVGSLRPTREIEIKRALGQALGWIELSAL
jgi:mRNA interferase MazF